MHGVARAGAAVTIVNGLPTGVGCALGIDLFTEVEATLEPGPDGRSRGLRNLTIVEGTPTPLVDAAVRESLDRWGGSTGWDVELRMRTEIPIARGLKSSSAVANAVALAIARALGKRPDLLDIAGVAAMVGRRSGTSATGALDDALSSLRPGFVVTDNLRDQLLRTGTVDSDVVAGLWIPATTHAPSPNWLETFRAEASEGQLAVNAALAGDWWAAMERNSRLVERIMGYSYGELRSRASVEGALGSGVSGLGPTFAALGTQATVERTLEALPALGGERRVVRLRSTAELPSEKET
jgi:shikimate kinase